MMMEKHEFVKHATSSLCAEIVDGLETGLPVVCERSEFDPIHVPARPEQQQWKETFPACLHCGHPGEHHDEEFGNCQESTDPKCEYPGYEAAVQPANEPERVSDERLEEISEQEMSEWISVKERLPDAEGVEFWCWMKPNDGFVLTDGTVCRASAAPFGKIAKTYRNREGEMRFTVGALFRVTHWQPLTAPPEGA